MSTPPEHPDPLAHAPDAIEPAGATGTADEAASRRAGEAGAAAFAARMARLAAAAAATSDTAGDDGAPDAATATSGVAATTFADLPPIGDARTAEAVDIAPTASGLPESRPASPGLGEADLLAPAPTTETPGGADGATIVPATAAGEFAAPAVKATMPPAAEAATALRFGVGERAADALPAPALSSPIAGTTEIPPTALAVPALGEVAAPTFPPAPPQPSGDPRVGIVPGGAGEGSGGPVVADPAEREVRIPLVTADPAGGDPGGAAVTAGAGRDEPGPVVTAGAGRDEPGPVVTAGAGRDEPGPVVTAGAGFDPAGPVVIAGAGFDPAAARLTNRADGDWGGAVVADAARDARSGAGVVDSPGGPPGGPSRYPGGAPATPDGGGVEPEPAGPQSLRARFRSWRFAPVVEIVATVALALLLAESVQAAVVKPFVIPSQSMEPTLLPGQRVLVNRLAYDFGGTPSRGDIVVFHPPSSLTCKVNVPLTEPCPKGVATHASDYFVKRVIGLPGDTLSIRNGHPVINGKELVDEPYITPCSDSTSCNMPHAIVIPRGDYYMLGDNRGDSDDSRYWGPVPLSWIIGEVFATYWPIDRIGVF